MSHSRCSPATPTLPDRWPAEALSLFVELFLAGRPAIRVVEALDQRGVWTRLLPEWLPVRAKPQHNAYHRFTVDRHLLEATANAAELVDRVQRPELLVIGALMHDIGKGYPGDHTEVGMELVAYDSDAAWASSPDDVGHSRRDGRASPAPCPTSRHAATSTIR